ncbi:MAG: hypothetical protein U5R49_08725 [Deltaproteobacteria bacterium]|nr:hypothetical protein [Deltaproteobacteria bacterium]
MFKAGKDRIGLSEKPFSGQSEADRFWTPIHLIGDTAFGLRRVYTIPPVTIDSYETEQMTDVSEAQKG